MKRLVSCVGFLMAAGVWLISGCAIKSTVSEPMHITVAKAEALRHGWKKVQVDYSEFRNGFWEVHVYRPPRTVSGRDAWVKISPDGNVVDFSINTR